jgi:predicted dehydrogenase
MTTDPKNRREFLKSSLGSAATVALAGSTRRLTRLQTASTAARPARIRFAAIGLNHSHISGQVDTVIRGGGQLVSFFAKETDLAGAFVKRFPDAKLARSEREILDDPSIQLVVSAAVPNERAPLGIEVMRHGKDFMVDKPGTTTLEQLADVRRVQAETNRIYSVLIERLESKAINKAGELVKAGAIGQVIQTVGLAPHRMNPETRAPWFFERERYGGVLCDLASHNIDAFLFLTGSTRADIVASQVGNVHHPQYPGLEDFGDVMLNGDGGGGYIRVDWLSPAGLTTYGDGRLTILGTEGYIELRKTVDIAGRPGGNHLFLVDQKSARYVDCGDVPLPYPTQLVDDVLNRTTSSDSQTRTFLAMELALKAQRQARSVNPSSR